MTLIWLALKSLRRNRLRSALTALAVFVLAVLFSMIVTIVLFLDQVMAVQSRDVKQVLTDRFRIPSRFDRRYIDRIAQPGGSLGNRLAAVPGFHPDKHTVWCFVAFNLDPELRDKNLQFVVIATLPEKIPLMIDGLEDLDPRLCALMRDPPRTHRPNAGLLIGPDRLRKLGKKVGDIFPAKSISHRDGTPARLPIEMEFEIVGALPAAGRWSQGAFIDYAYLDRVLKEKKNEFDGKVNLGWLMTDDQESASQVAGAVEEDIRDLKCETASSAIGRFLEPYKGLLWGLKYLLRTAITVVMIVIVANAIGITVRERIGEMAVLKVLGYSRSRILALVLGEAVLIAVPAGFLGSAATYVLVNYLFEGIKFPIAFFPVFFVSPHAWWWGAALGAFTALVGGLVPAWNACSVKVAEVFSKVA